MSGSGPLAGERYHLFGIAGRGMAPLAVAARHLGAEVTGCDRAGLAEMCEFLETSGMPFVPTHSPDHVRPGTTLVATGIAASDEPEIRAADAAGARWHRTDLLAAVLRTGPSAAVSGSHGKGTVTALAGAALDAAGLDPLVVVGVPVPAFGGMVRLGDGPVVAEVDDSDLTLSRVDSQVAVVTNLDDDHPHLSCTLQDSVVGVGRFVARARGTVVLGPSPRADSLAAYAEAEVWRYGRDFSARTVEVKGGETRLELRGPGGVRVPAVIRLIGPRTTVNASLAFATAVALGADPEAAADGLGRVSALYRRLQPVGIRGGVRVFDDYGGKHPVAVRTGIEALRRHFPDSRITAVFQPYGPYLTRWGHRYARALGLADRVVLAPPVLSPDYASEAPYDEDWSDACPVTPLQAPDQREAAEAAMGLSGPGDVVAFFAQVSQSQVMARHAVSVGTFS